MQEEKTRWRRPTRGRRSLVRIDSSPVNEEPAAPAPPSDLKAILRACARLALGERREAARLVPAERRGWLGWRVGPRAFDVLPVELDNISVGGAMVTSPRTPPSDQPVWLCLGNPAPTEGLRSAVVAATELKGGGQRIRLAFQDPCPEDFFLTFVTGEPPVYETVDDVAPEPPPTRRQDRPRERPLES